MLNRIVHFSIRFRAVIVALASMLIAYGIYSLSHAKYDVFPEFGAQEVEIQTEAPGLAPEQVEVLVTLPIEDAINGVPGIESLRSNSIQGLSVITITLNQRSDLYRNRQEIAERLATLVGKFPQGVEAPVITPLTSSTGDLMSIGLTSKKLSLMELRTLATWTIKPRLLAVEGVAKIGIFGGEVTQFQVQVRPEKLVQYDLSIEDIITTTQKATGVRGAGFLDAGEQRFIIRTEGQSITPEELAKVTIVHALASGPSISIPLGEVAKITQAPEPLISAASVMGEPGLVLNLWVQNGANTLETTEGVERAMEQLRPSLEAKGIAVRTDLFRAANFVERAVHNIKTSLMYGAALVIVILFLFLFNLRTAMISCIAIPLSLLAAVTLLDYLGFTLNVMTLGGLAIAIGEVVDDAVIDVENILRRLRENRHSAHPLPASQVVLHASLEVRSAVVYATFAVVLVFLPILTMPGLAGRFFAPMGFAYILAVMASLVMALTVTPALCYLLLNKKDLREHDTWFLRGLKSGYRAFLRGVERVPRLVMITAFLLTAIGIATFFLLKREFLPEFREGHFIIHVTAEPGTSLQESLKIGKEITDKLLQTPFVRSVAQRVGRAESDDIFGTHESELEVDLKELHGDEFEEAEDSIKKVMEQFSKVDYEINTFLAERISETLSGYTEPVVVNIFGDDLDALGDKGNEVLAVMKEVPGSEEVQLQSLSGVPQISVQLRKADLSYWGFDPVDVLEAIRSAYQGEDVGQIFEGNRVYDVAVILDPKSRSQVDDVGSLPLRNPTGTYVKLRQLADIKKTTGRYVVLHEGARRVQTITSGVEGREVSAFVEDLRKQIQEKVKLPPGMFVDISGTAEAEAQSRHDLFLHASIAGIGIVLLLSVIARNFRNLLLILVNLPFALVGGVLAVWLTHGSISMGALVGFVTLFGITLRNSIMMISHYEHIVLVEGLPWGMDAAIRGASERLIPILMTALVTGLGLLPLALRSGTPGREIEGPMAIVILGGLITSTLLNLMILPTLALRYGRFQKGLDE